MHNFRKLNVWQKSRKLVTKIYKTANTFPKVEDYGLTAQMKRCSISIPSNIAEGCGRGTTKQLLYFLDIALSSSWELETQVLIGNDLEYIDKDLTEQLSNRNK